MSPANGVFCLFYVLLESLRIMVLDQIHPLTIQSLNWLPNMSKLLVVFLKLESLTPMTKIWRYDKNWIWIVKVRSKQFSILLLHRIISCSNHDWNQFKVFAQTFANIWQMHLETMFLILIIRFNIFEFPFIFQLFSD